MHKKRWLYGGLAVLIFLILTLGVVVGGGLSLARQPNFNSLLPVFSSPVQVRLFNPGSGGMYPADSFLYVQATVESEDPIEQVELWINGILYQAYSASNQGSTNFLAEWHWQPGMQGSYSLLVRAFDSAGHTGVSGVALIQVTPPAGYSELVTIQAGDTLNSLAEQYGTTPEQILWANPHLTGSGDSLGNPPGGGEGTSSGSLEFNQLLPPDFVLAIPQDTTIPIDFQNFSLDSLDQSGVDSPSGDQPPDEPGQPASPGNLSLFDKFSFKLSTLFFPAGDSPAAPTIGLWYYQNGQWPFPCHPSISIERHSNDEDGYFLYRSGGGNPALQRIGSADKAEPGYGGPHYITDMDDITGVFTYVASAYNNAGETFSQPLVIDLSKCDYAPGSQFATQESTTGGVGIANGYLTIPSSVNLAYLYVGINGTFWERIPPGSSKFLSGSGYQFNLNEYLASLISQVQATDLEVTIEVWGWQGDQVGLIGSYTGSIRRAVLTVCSQEGKTMCQGAGGSAGWTGEVFLSTEKPLQEQYYDLRLELSQLLKSDSQIYQVSYKPFSGPGFQDSQGILFSGLIDKQGSSILNFPLIAYYNDDKLVQGSWGMHYSYDSNFLKIMFPPGKPFSIYIRVIPIDILGNLGLPSNTVVLHYQTSAEPQEPYPLASDLPSLYTVEILDESYQPPVFINPVNWGCVIVQNNISIYTIGEVKCPPPRDFGPGSWDAGSLLTGTANLISQGLSDLSELFEVLKDGIVNAVAGIIPGCGDDCKAILKKGLEVGITALTGLPPSLPNFDQMAAQGVLYAVDQVQSSLTGYECGSLCEDKLQGELENMIRVARTLQSEPSCAAVNDVAWFYGKEPGWCLPPYVLVAPYPGGSNQPGMVMVRVTRNSTAAPPGDLSGQYYLDIAPQGTNDTRKGTFGNECIYYPDGYPVSEPEHYYLEDHVYSFYKDQEQGELYNPVRIPMPLLNPGDSVELPIALQPLGHDNTKDVYFPQVGCDGFASFKYLFFKGASSITATESCYVVQNGTFVPCTQGGTDFFTTVNPQDPSNQWP